MRRNDSVARTTRDMTDVVEGASLPLTMRCGNCGDGASASDSDVVGGGSV